MSQLLVPITLRGGTAAEWQAENPLLLEYEAGYDSTARRFKMGDGTTSWNALPYGDANPPVFRGLFVSGSRYLLGQYVEGADGFAYMARRSLTAQAQPIPGANWRRTSWGTMSTTGPQVGATITEWEPKTYPAGLVVVLFNFTLYQLTADVLPFESTDLELEAEFGQWTPICCDGTAAVAPNLYLLAQDGRRILDENGQPITVN